MEKQNLEILRAKIKYLKLLQKFPPEQSDYEAVFKRIRDKELKRHPSAKFVQELRGGEPRAQDGLLDMFGYPDARLVAWSRDESVIYDREGNEVANGGFVVAARLPGEEKISTFIFLRNSVDVPESVKACALLAYMMHEMGHVDDIEKGKYLRIGEVNDLVAAEEYAHRYALRRMMRENLRHPMGFLLSTIHADARERGDAEAAGIAAKRIIGSGEYKQFRAFVGGFFHLAGDQMEANG
jgi:hypothetical protein